MPAPPVPTSGAPGSSRAGDRPPPVAAALDLTIEAHLRADAATRDALETALHGERTAAALRVHDLLSDTHDPERWTRLFLLFQRLRHRGPWAAGPA